MLIHIGTIRSNCSGFNAIADIATKTEGAWFESIELDLASCSFFEANMAAPLYAVIARLREELNDVSIVNVPSGVSTILRKNKFLSVFNQPELTDTNQTTLPFKILKLTAGDQFNDYLDAYMRGRGIPTMSEALTKRFRQSLFEIFLNATLHSQSKAGIFICGQFYPNKHRLDFTIADAGVKSCKLNVYDIYGRNFYSSTLTPVGGKIVQAINLSDLSKGVYFLKVESEEGIFNTKLTIE